MEDERWTASIDPAGGSILHPSSSILTLVLMSLRVRQTLTRVIVIQLITLALLWLLQQRYAG